ncbi:helix-turn-helix domain-containing protein [Rhodococcus rhodochrous]|uniref:Helix-turn-helix domain-containing protein n=1 Tax=Rhodococcus rhodochrous TaxID=1829 RepID=A0AA46WRS8_RHORH|nr:helix-turn-helix domain-containing protein [Rhodococcus rhodochrous]UZF43188.1 helix-turn-helix domain-containing protein [Rhodococcus rhodochrous]
MSDVPSWRYDWRKAVNRDYRLTHTERRVLFELDSAANPDGTNARPGNTLIAENLRMNAEKGMNEKSVRRALDRGVELGYIEQTAKARRVSESVWLAAVWRLIPPASVDTQMSSNNQSSVDIPESSVDILEPTSGHSASHEWTSGCPDTRSLTPDHSHQSTNTSVVAPASTSRKRSSPTRGVRISEDFQPQQENVEWAETNHPGVDLSTETEKFVNYWLAESGAKAAKRNWDRTWRNWIINAAKYASARPARSTSPYGNQHFDIGESVGALYFGQPKEHERPSYADSYVIEGEIA